MAARATHLFLSAVLLLLMAPTPFPARFVGQLLAARTALGAGRPDLALPPMEAALAREPGLAEISLDMVEVALQARQPKLAQALIRSLPADRKTGAQIECYLARAALQSGDWREALAHSSSSNPPCAASLAGLERLAAGMIAAGEFDSARSLLQQLEPFDPVNPELLFESATLLAVRQPAQAVSRLETVLRLDPEFRPAADLLAAVQTDPEGEGPAYLLAQVGQALARRGEWALAAEAFGAALRSTPDYVEAQAYYGLALDRSGGNGLEQLEAALAAAPEAALPNQLLGKHWRAAGEPVLALQAFEIAAELSPDDPLIAADLGWAYAEVGDLPAARAAYVRAAELAPEDPVMWQLLARFSINFELELRQLGIPAARRAVALQPESPVALDLLGFAYFAGGDWELAERFLSRAIELQPGSASAHYHLGLLLLSRGDTRVGISALQRAWDLDPDGAVGDLAVRSLENLP